MFNTLLNKLPLGHNVSPPVPSDHSTAELAGTAPVPVVVVVVLLGVSGRNEGRPYFAGRRSDNVAVPHKLTIVTVGVVGCYAYAMP